MAGPTAFVFRISASTVSHFIQPNPLLDLPGRWENNFQLEITNRTLGGGILRLFSLMDSSEQSPDVGNTPSLALPSTAPGTPSLAFPINLLSPGDTPPLDSKRDESAPPSPTPPSAVIHIRGSPARSNPERSPEYPEVLTQESQAQSIHDSHENDDNKESKRKGCCPLWMRPKRTDSVKAKKEKEAKSAKQRKAEEEARVKQLIALGEAMDRLDTEIETLADDLQLKKGDMTILSEEIVNASVRRANLAKELRELRRQRQDELAKRKPTQVKPVVRTFRCLPVMVDMTRDAFRFNLTAILTIMAILATFARAKGLRDCSAIRTVDQPFCTINSNNYLNLEAYNAEQKKNIIFSYIGYGLTLFANSRWVGRWWVVLALPWQAAVLHERFQDYPYCSHEGPGASQCWDIDMNPLTRPANCSPPDLMGRPTTVYVTNTTNVMDACYCAALQSCEGQLGNLRTHAPTNTFLTICLLLVVIQLTWLALEAIGSLVQRCCKRSELSDYLAYLRTRALQDLWGLWKARLLASPSLPMRLRIMLGDTSYVEANEDHSDVDQSSGENNTEEAEEKKEQVPFRYPVRILTGALLIFCMLLLLLFQSLFYLNFLKTQTEDFKVSMMMAVMEMLSNNTGISFEFEHVTLVFDLVNVCLFLTIMIALVSVLYTLRGFRKAVEGTRAEGPTLLEPEEYLRRRTKHYHITGWEVMDSAETRYRRYATLATLGYASNFLGTWLVTVVFAVFICWFQLTVLFLIFFHPLIRGWLWSLRKEIWKIVRPAVIQFISIMIAKYFLIGNVPFSIKYPQLYSWMDFVLTVLSVAVGPLAAAIRILQAFYILTMRLFRIDLPLLPDPLAYQDKGYRGYLASVTAHRYLLWMDQKEEMEKRLLGATKGLKVSPVDLRSLEEEEHGEDQKAGSGLANEKNSNSEPNQQEAQRADGSSKDNDNNNNNNNNNDSSMRNRSTLASNPPDSHQTTLA
eukprot:g48466.t1